mmetsp:Transcript_136118/g.236569  ORF Transcript_136118/g.236569 Transcript_136118/m.236569 type:complete len:81 (+) Transcript_136118:258-500(+)
MTSKYPGDVSGVDPGICGLGKSTENGGRNGTCTPKTSTGFSLTDSKVKPTRFGKFSLGDALVVTSARSMDDGCIEGGRRA